VTLFCEVKNIDDEETVNLTIYEHDDDGEHDHIKDLSGEVKDGKIEVPWIVEYHEDNDDSNSAEEIEEYGYTLPEYFFVAKYGDVESEESKLLYTKVKLTTQLADEDTGEIWAERKYTMLLPDGSEETGTTDKDGYIEPTASPIGNVTFIIHKKEDANAK
jgi:hypothetical protein